MKRLGIILVAALAFSGNAFAGKVANDSTAVKWDGEINKGKLVQYLKVSNAQYDEVADICDYFKEQMAKANNASENQKELTRNAVYGNLKLMKKTLSDEQYSNYLRLMAMTLRNKGINIDK